MKSLGDIRVSATFVMLLTTATASQAENWPCWRGPTGMGYCDEKDLPLHWDGKTKENLLWKAPLGGIGNSSPIVWGERVFVTVSRKAIQQGAGRQDHPAALGRVFPGG